MKGYTIKEVKSWGACYPRERLEALYAGRETLTARECLDLDIPDEDKLYALLRPEVLPGKELHFLACDFAERVVHLTRDPCSAEAIRVKRLWLEGKASDVEMGAAKAAAKAATRTAKTAAIEWVAKANAAWAAKEDAEDVEAAARTWAKAEADAAKADAAWAAANAAWVAAAMATTADAARAAANTAAEASAAAAWEAAAEAAAARASAARAEARAAERKAQLALVREVIERLDSNEGA